MSKNKKLIPELRFPEFRNEDEWEEKELGKLAKKTSERNKSELVKNVFTNSAIDGIIDQRDYFDKDIADKNNLENYFIVEEGDYVYNPRISNIAPVGPISKNKTNKKGAMSPLYTVFRFYDKKNDFYEHYFKSLHWYNAIRKASNTGARFDRMSITDSAFMEIPVLFPKPAEQQKIASCLSSLDEVIEAHSQKLELLKDHKKGLMQNLFPQEEEKVPKLRFKEFENDGEWVEIKLGKISKRILSKNKDGKTTSVFTNSAINGIVDQRDYFEKDIANKGSLENYYLVKDGDYVYNPRISIHAPVGPLSKNRLGKTGVMSPLYTVFRFNEKSNDFYEYYFQTPHWHKAIKSASNTGARFDRMSITASSFMEISVLQTSIEEQQKISSCLSALDELITAQAEKIEQLKQHKKGLMQSLFPKMND